MPRIDKSTQSASRARQEAATSAPRVPAATPGPRGLQPQAVVAGMRDSPRLVAQRQQLHRLFGGAVPPIVGASAPSADRAEAVQRQASEAVEASPPQRDVAEAATNPGPLPRGLQRGIESLSGVSMSAVRVHYNSPRPAQLQALAYAQGQDIHLATGQEHHLPHEAWHVVQQAQGRVQPTLQLQGRVPVNDEERLEREADEMGARALQAQGLRRAAPSVDPASTALHPVTQRRIGFEMETGIPVAEQVPGGGGAGPTYQALNNDGLESPFPGGKLMVDHLPGHVVSPLENYTLWNIVEFVTDPIDDRLSEANFRHTATTWVHDLQALEAYAQAHHSPVQNAPGVGAPGSGLPVHIGIPAGGDAAARWNRFAPQATMGIKLRHIGDILANETHAQSFAGKVPHDRVTLGAQPASATADAVMADIHAAYPMRFRTHRDGYQELQGLLVLICNYLLTGAANAGRMGYRKNFTTMMYKSKLSSVRNDIIGMTYPAAMLGTLARRVAVRNMILNRTGVAPGAEVFDGIVDAGLPVLAAGWLSQVLAGTEDRVFMAMKNPWSNEIAPEDIHGRSGAVMEMRSSGDFGIDVHGIAGLADTVTIVDYLTRIYLANKRWSR